MKNLRLLSMAERLEATKRVLIEHGRGQGPILTLVAWFVFLGNFPTRFIAGPGAMPERLRKTGVIKDDQYRLNRVIITDCILLAKFTLFVLFLVFLNDSSRASWGVLIGIRFVSLLALWNLVAAVLYYSLFRKTPDRSSHVHSRARIVALAFSNYFESLLIFSVFYKTIRGFHLPTSPLATTLDFLPDSLTSVYFSGITGLTVGFGDIYPLAVEARMMVVLQGTVSIMILSVLLSRAIGSLPAIKEKGYDDPT